MKRFGTLGAGFLAAIAAAFFRSFHCLKSFNISQDDLRRAACAHYLPEAGLWDFAAHAFKRACLSFEPLSDILFWLLRFAGWGAPPGPRILAAVLLAACTFMIVLIAFRFLRDKRWAAAAGFFYLLHPMHNINESMLGVPHYMAVLLNLTSFALHMKESDSPAQKPRVLTTCALYLAAALFKETGLLLPLFLLGYDSLYRRKNPGAIFRSASLRKKYAPLILTALIYAVFRLNLCGEENLLSLSAIGGHLKQTLSKWSCLPIVFTAVAALFTAEKDDRTNRSLAFCGFWFLLGSSIYLVLPGHYEINGRHLFLPYAALSWALAVSLDALSRRKAAAAVLILPPIVLALLVDGSGRIGCRSREDQLESIRAGLAQCSSPSQFSGGLNSRCVDSAASLALMREMSPGDYQETLSLLKRALSPEDLQTLKGFYGAGTISGNCPKWAYIFDHRREWLGGKPLIPLLEAYTTKTPRD